MAGGRSKLLTVNVFLLDEPSNWSEFRRDEMPTATVPPGDLPKAQDRRALYSWELSDADLRALELSEPSAAAAQFDNEVE